MEEKVREMGEKVDMTQTATTHILQRLNQFLNEAHPCTCCKLLEEKTKELDELTVRVRGLDIACKERDVVFSTLQQQFDTLKSQHESLQCDVALLTQTDDSKIRQAAKVSRPAMVTGLSDVTMVTASQRSDVIHSTTHTAPTTDREIPDNQQHSRETGIDVEAGLACAANSMGASDTSSLETSTMLDRGNVTVTMVTDDNVSINKAEHGSHDTSRSTWSNHQGRHEVTPAQQGVVQQPYDSDHATTTTEHVANHVGLHSGSSTRDTQQGGKIVKNDTCGRSRTIDQVPVGTGKNSVGHDFVKAGKGIPDSGDVVRTSQGESDQNFSLTGNRPTVSFSTGSVNNSEKLASLIMAKDRLLARSVTMNSGAEQTPGIRLQSVQTQVSQNDAGPATALEAGNGHNTATATGMGIAKWKPNFVNTKDQAGIGDGSGVPQSLGTVEVVHQPTKVFRPLDTDEVNELVEGEMAEGKEAGMSSIGGVHSIILLDISASMETAWPQVQTFINDYLQGLEISQIQLGVQCEYVSLVTFGHEIKVQQRFTTQYSLIREIFGKLKVGGPSSFKFGYALALGVHLTPEKQTCLVSNIEVPTKLIVITDGAFTPDEMRAGPDELEPGLVDITREKILRLLDEAQKFTLDYFYVPVGNAEEGFLQLLCSIHEGKMLTYKEGEQLSRRTYLTFSCNIFGGARTRDNSTFSEQDLKDIAEIEAKGTNHLMKLLKGEDTYAESQDSSLPQPGSRVQRGPDWKSDDREDVHFTIGTIVGHSLNSKGVWVDWDGGEDRKLKYRFGADGHYEVIVVDEPRMPEPGSYMAVGCQVQPGAGWSESRRPSSDIGVVLRLHMDSSNVPKALVRWRSGDRGEYTYMLDESSAPEIQPILDNPRQHGMSSAYGAGSLPSAGATPPNPRPATRTRRNKNKNIT